MVCLGFTSVRAGQELAKIVPDHLTPEYLKAIEALSKDLEAKSPQEEWKEIKASWNRTIKRIFKHN